MTFTGQAIIKESQTRPYTATFSCPGNLTGGTAEIVHITTTASDVTVDGTFSIVSGSATVNVSCLTDQVPESTETFRIRLRDSNGATLAESFIITISANFPQYILTGPSEICEGSLETYTVETSNVPDGTVVAWQINHITTSAADFLATSGTVTINGGQGTFSVSVGADTITDPDERFSIDLLSGGQAVDNSGPIYIRECPRPCGSFQGSGGGTYDSRTFDMPSAAGDVFFQYEAFTVPDKFEVYFGSVRVFSTGGEVSGYGETTLTKPSGVTLARVVVTSSDADTQWQYSLGCPTNPLP